MRLPVFRTPGDDGGMPSVTIMSHFSDPPSVMTVRTNGVNVPLVMTVGPDLIMVLGTDSVVAVVTLTVPFLRMSAVAAMPVGQCRSAEKCQNH